VSVRLAVVNPCRDRFGPPLTISEELVKLALAAMLSTRMFEVPLREPPPVQPVMVMLRPPPRAVRLAVVIPLKPSAMPSVEESEG
jgi:hypothetical protein